NIAGHYEFAAANRDVYDAVPCYCGCEKSIGHRNLTDCFVRSDGTGWDAHAAGCAVCIDESITVRRLMADGADAPTIRDSIIAEYAPLTTTTTTTTTTPTTTTT
ncbi:MAG TPA: PCYCGC motif-containing (lipo)protein, partial [Ilumatobacteraceae bacterium]|nr:PCYCGC motif-containing (lipo)protein [Ilumatobacteraceae bacterium]